MPRPLSKKLSPAEKKAHEARLQVRRDRRASKKAVERAVLAASAAAEGEVDWENLVDYERTRLEGKAVAKSAKGGKNSPKVTAMARDQLADAFDFMGGVPALVAWGKRNPTEFYRLWARLIPKEVAEPVGAIPLESLLEKLATREHLSVHAAAVEIGEEAMEAGRKQALIEDATGLRPEEIN